MFFQRIERIDVTGRTCFPDNVLYGYIFAVKAIVFNLKIIRFVFFVRAKIALVFILQAVNEQHFNSIA